MRKILLYIFSFQSLFIFYIPIYIMFRYEYSWSNICINFILLSVLFSLIKDLRIKWVNNEFETGFKIQLHEDKE